MKKKNIRTGPGRPPTINDPHLAIRRAAAALFAGRGFESTSLQDVATAVGVTKAGLYHYFPTKRGLFEAIVLGTLQELQDGATAAIAAKANHQDKLIAFMVAHARYFSENGDNYKASFFGHGGGDLSNFTKDQLASRKAYLCLLEGVLEGGVREGTLKVPDIPVVARGILGMLNWMARWYRPDGSQTAPQIAETYAKTILSGIAAR